MDLCAACVVAHSEFEAALADDEDDPYLLLGVRASNGDESECVQTHLSVLPVWHSIKSVMPATSNTRSQNAASPWAREPERALDHSNPGAVDTDYRVILQPFSHQD